MDAGTETKTIMSNDSLVLSRFSYKSSKAESVNCRNAAMAIWKKH
jgi:hypothetical protein